MSLMYAFKSYGTRDGQQLVEGPDPRPSAGELLVAVRAAGVNPIDWKIRSGILGEEQPLPVPMGREVSGVVTAVGDGVEDFAVGNEVLGVVAPGYGGFAELTVIRAAEAVLKPEELSFTDAAAIPVAGAAAYDGTHQIELDAGQTLLILGIGGGVGLMAAQIGQVHQFTVLGTASASKREVVESTGATLVPYEKDLAQRVRELAPDGVDLILDLVGGQALRELAPAVRESTRIISAADPDTVTELGGTPLRRTPEALAKITEVIKYGLVDPHVSAVFPLERADEAIATVENGHTTGKVVIEINQD